LNASFSLSPIGTKAASLALKELWRPRALILLSRMGHFMDFGV
jgi:hypothetical protein